MGLPACMGVHGPVIAASGGTVEATPCCTISSDRICGTQPSDRSPLTAAQAGADGDSLHIRTGGESANATFVPGITAAAPNTANMKGVLAIRVTALNPLRMIAHSSVRFLS